MFDVALFSFYYFYYFFSLLDDDTQRIRPFGQPLCLTSDDYSDYINDSDKKTKSKSKKKK